MKNFKWAFFFVFLFTSLVLGQDKLLTIDDIFHPQKKVAFSGTPTFGVRWSSDGTSFVRPRMDGGAMKFVKENAKTGEEVVFYDSSIVTEALVKIGISEADAKGISRRVVSQNDPTNSVLLTSGEDLFVYNSMLKIAKRLTDNKPEELEADFSPNGLNVSFVRGNDLFVVDVASGKETQFTKDGTKNILNGYLAWVYEEELYGRGQNRGYWWSPDSTSIAFLRTDDSKVPMFVMADDTVTDQNIEDVGYPQAGDPNPLVTFHVANVASGKSFRYKYFKIQTGRFPDFPR